MRRDCKLAAASIPIYQSGRRASAEILWKDVFLDNNWISHVVREVFMVHLLSHCFCFK